MIKDRHHISENMKYASSGQALILVVLIMFLLLGLSGVFITLIANANVVAVRASDRDRLTNAVKSGFDYAVNNLLYSNSGSDWISDSGPDKANPGWIRSGNAFYKVDVSYGSPVIKKDTDIWLNNNEENFKYIKVDVDARYMLDNEPDLGDVDEAESDAYYWAFRSGKRYLHRHIVAYMPIGLTDNIIWVTNTENSPEPIILGSTLGLSDINLIVNAGSDIGQNYVNDDEPYYNSYNGNLLINGNTMIGNMHLILRTGGHNYITRRDNVTVDGYLLENTNRVFKNKYFPFNAPASFNSGTDIDIDSSDVIDRSKQPLMQYVHPPSINLDRYRRLTRDSVQAISGTYSRPPSLYGRGYGIYINNQDDIQYAHDLQQLHNDFVSIDSTEESSAWLNGNYDPFGIGKAAEIVFVEYRDPSDPSKPGIPKIQLSHRDSIFYDEVLDRFVNSITIDYPRNGVIFAEGNLVVRGDLPISRNLDPSYYTAGKYIDVLGGRVGGATYKKDDDGYYTEEIESITYYASDLNRRYDLTIVSGGTIYIDGSIESPSSRGATIQKETIGAAITIISGDPYDTKLALLASDDVVLNPTNMISYFGDSNDVSTIDSKAWIVDNASIPFEIRFRLSGKNSNIAFALKTAGDGSSYDPTNYSAVNMYVNGVPYVFDDTAATLQDQRTFFFGSSAAKAGYFSWVNPIAWSMVMVPPSTVWHNLVIGDPSGFDYIDESLLLRSGLDNSVRFTLGLGSTTGYYIAIDEKVKPVVPHNYELIVDALIYAEKGSWFIIPGSFYNNDDTINKPADDILLVYRESPDVKIKINGAITMNLPAGVQYESEWLKHWRGTNSSYFGPDGDLDPATSLDPYDGSGGWKADRTTGITYTYDPGLFRPVCYNIDDDGDLVRYMTRCPKLPVSPTILSYGMNLF